MTFVVVGTKHKHSPIGLREKISFSRKKLKDALLFLRESKFLGGRIWL